MTDFYDTSTGLLVLKKQPSESRLFDFDFSGKMRSGDSIASIVSISFQNMGEVAGSGDISHDVGSISGPLVQTRIDAGDSLENYKMTAKITTTPTGDTLEGDGMLYVRDA